jgi:LDH2 family malate/lactate/ureidoglycolate dehydrogenase
MGSELQVLTWPAGNGLGQVIAARAMGMAIGKANTTGLGTVAVRNSSHFGRAELGLPWRLRAESMRP